MPEEIPPAGAWRRFFARNFDVTLEVMLLAVAWVMIDEASLDKTPDLLAGALVLLLSFAFDSLIYLLCGNTLGKWLLGIRVLDESGRRVPAKTQLIRNFSVYLNGFGLGIPIVTLITQAIQYRYLACGQRASYDQSLGLHVASDRKHWIKTLFFVLSFVFLLTLLVALQLASLE